MLRKTPLALLLTLVLLHAGFARAASVTYDYHLCERSRAGAAAADEAGWLTGNDGSGIPLPVVCHSFLLENGRLDSVTITRSGPVTVPNRSALPSMSLQTTFAGDRFREPGYYADKLAQLSGGDLAGISSLDSYARSKWGAAELIDILLSPLEFDSGTGLITRYHRATVRFHGDHMLAIRELRGLQDYSRLLAPIGESGDREQPGLSSPQSGPTYLVVTNQELAPAFEPLLRWKRIKGLTAEIALIETISATEAGVDAAARLRSYLRKAYSNGTRYCLLGGDENVLPVRYAFHQNSSEYPDLELQQLCDLYFADVSGDWDSDGDGVYGEVDQDAADVYPELLLGRLPADEPAEVSAYIDKLLRYEQNPDPGESGYLTRSLLIAADQMRDYGEGGGQHLLIAESFPDQFTHDASSLIEAPTGAAENPLEPTAERTVSLLSESWGFISLLVHGISDGWVARSRLYNQWPKSYIYAREGTIGVHGYLPQAEVGDRPGLVYSIGCSHGAFDMDSPPFTADYPCIAEHFLLQPGGGAVAFVGYSRWGWVSLSWLLEKALLEYLFYGGNNVAEALAYSKAQYPHLRDINYGLNLYGDPELSVWSATPASINLTISGADQPGATELAVVLTDHQGPIGEAIVTLTQDDRIVYQGLTGADGIVTPRMDFSEESNYRIYAYKPGYALARDYLTPATVLSSDEEQPLPAGFQLYQNFPNPFNSTTRIGFSLQRPARTSLVIYNILGQQIRTLMARRLFAGTHEVIWDGTDQQGAAQPSGAYFALLRADAQESVIKLTLLK